MQRPPRGSSHFHCSSLYGPTLTIPNLPPLLLILIFFPITHTQMTNNSTLSERYFQNDSIHKENNYTIKKGNESNITFKNKNITTTVSKEYQILLDRFRRKNLKNMTGEGIFYDIGNLTDNLDDISTNNNFNVGPHRNSSLDHQKHSLKLHNIDLLDAKDAEDTSAIEKLRMDDETRTKIFHDYYSTVNKVNAINEEQNINESITMDVLDYNETIDILFNETEIPQTVTDPKIRRRFSNDSLVFPDNLSSSRVPTIMQTSRPEFVEEISRSSSNRIVSILGLFELSVGVAPRAEGASELAAAQLAVQHVNRRGLLPGYKLHLFTNDTKCDPGVGVDRFFHALYTERESRMVMLLGSACSEVTESIAKIVPYWNIVQVSFGSTSPALSDRSEFPLFCRTVAPDSSHNPARIAFIRQFGWDTVTAFSQNEEVYSLAVNELVTQLEAANITCAASITFAESDFKEQLQQLKELDTRIIIGSFSQEMIPKIFCEAFKLGMWGAEYAWVVAGAPPRLRAAPPCARAQLATALEGLVSVTAHRGIVGDAVSYSGLTNEMFHREMAAVGVAVSPYAPQTYDAVWAIALALAKAEQLWRDLDMTHYNGTLLKGGAKMGLSHFDYNRKDMAEEFLNQLANLSFLGVSGPVSFNGADRIGTSAFYQIQGGRPKTVALYTQGRALACVGCARAAWGGGVPAARRVLVLRVDSVWAPARLAVAALAAAGVALATAFLAFNLHYSKRRSIKLSSPRLNNMTLIGCVLVYTAVALLGVDNSNLPPYVSFSAMCIGRVYILSAGFSLAFGSMFAKTYRVHRIFVSNRSGVCKTKLLQDTPLISLVCALLLLDGLLVTLWAALDPMQRQLKNLTQEISADDRSVVYQPQIEVCKSQNTTGWLCALYAYKGLLLLVGVYMAWETRNVKISALNDSKYIGISVYSVVITSTSVVVIGTIISERATLAYITITSLILITTTSTLCLLFLPKIVAIRSSKTEDDPVIQSLGLRLECKTRRFVTDETQELHFRIEIQNKVYKREVAALDKEIGRLERLLAEPLESATSSNASIALHKWTELNTVEEEDRCRSDPERRTPSITGGLPMLLLSVLPPVIPRASWPSAEHCRGRNSVSFSSQPKLNYRKSQPTIDLYSLCLNKREEHHGLLSRIRSFFGGSSRPTSRKASTMSIADPTGQSIAAALKMHVGMIAGLVPGNRKHSMVLSCNTLNVPSYPELKLRRESYAKSGPIIRITDDEPSCSKYERPPQKYIAEPETKVNFVLPTIHKRPMSHENSCEKIKGSPRFPHRISPAASSLTALSGRKTSADSVFSITGRIFDEQRRYSHQNVTNQEPKGKAVLESRWKSTEDARAGPSSRN
ncbi:gamma-aminobutyric acid type B receptor subunit 2 [Cydia pomonella]|uniref:gamma-aminobutyric acid type B receptor subunit 2 n=1 Tax=Cydia pomonella TaxID=82600 RepID=UPI002ADDEDD8|nr:gamma-aminobutyric acid type B receptor subunit 2 [Cydia pomonella]XP_061729710.1 gamma-aminobutyric acid type B receptor subunit 2 [Cydia pomonella]XP_061729711.1 gamma-aminobutyric acid type B receptor subunit 2 [Cydia pomonella]